MKQPLAETTFVNHAVVIVDLCVCQIIIHILNKKLHQYLKVPKKYQNQISIHLMTLNIKACKLYKS